MKADSKRGREIVVATTAAGRMSGFPQMVLQGKTVVITWTDVVDEATQVRTARVEVP